MITRGAQHCTVEECPSFFSTIKHCFSLAQTEENLNLAAIPPTVDQTTTTNADLRFLEDQNEGICSGLYWISSNRIQKHLNLRQMTIITCYLFTVQTLWGTICLHLSIKIFLVVFYLKSKIFLWLYLYRNQKLGICKKLCGGHVYQLFHPITLYTCSIALCLFLFERSLCVSEIYF